MPANTIGVTLRPMREKIKIALLTISPMRAANILGPALISFFFIENSFTIARDIIANGLSFGRLVLRIRKSNVKKAGINQRRVNIKNITSKKVKSPFSLATFSSILLVEMGHVAYISIALVILFYKNCVSIYFAQRYIFYLSWHFIYAFLYFISVKKDINVWLTAHVILFL